MSVISIKDGKEVTTRSDKSSVPEWIVQRSASEIDAQNLDDEARRKLAERIAAIEDELDALVTAVLLELKNRRRKMARAAAEAALARHRVNIRKLGEQLDEATGGNALNTMRVVCHRVSDRHPESSNARGNIIEAAWDGVGYWRA